MSNYPPGVTGNEFEIAGPDREVTETRECEAQDQHFHVLTRDGRNALAELGGIVAEVHDSGTVHPTTFDAILSVTRRVEREVVSVEEADCPFVGEVDVAYFRSSCWWTCPVCGSEHQIEADEL